MSRLESLGKTTMLVRADDVFVGLLGLADTPRRGMREIFARLAALGIRRAVMLTGDNAQVAKAVAASVGITEVRAGLLPEDKLKVIDELMHERRQVAMVGDGVNDAPAMARATIGIAMGGAGTDVALETADVALMADDLSRLPFALALSRASHNVIRQNLWAAFGVVALLIPVTLFGLASMGIAVLVHEGATVMVVINALCLLWFVDAPDEHGQAWTKTRPPQPSHAGDTGGSSASYHNLGAVLGWTIGVTVATALVISGLLRWRLKP